MGTITTKDGTEIFYKDWGRGQTKTYKGFPRGMSTVHAETINADLLAFIRS